MQASKLQALKLLIAESGAELPLHEGVRALRRDAGVLQVDDDSADALVQLCLDRRGAWLNVISRAVTVHVNGRQVRQLALLRAGDIVYLDGSALLLISALEPESPPAAIAESESGELESGELDLRMVLRAMGGRHHGRSFTLDRPRLVGRVQEADIRIDDPGFNDRHAQLIPVGGQVMLRDLGSTHGCLVNGWSMRDAVLRPGDQLVFNGQHRFVLEGSGAALGTFEAPLPDEALALVDEDSGSHTWRRWPWLLLAALLLAGVLAALLLLGGS